ncbi:helix-turn-helix transcriptional regulator [Amycolatopsis orientalis]|uniref:helix-turn-helix transcriptional regulator n=1 Tax=Amycolatopsis orientalis TaxID=31958 RepID=UPI0003A392AE|nr:YafY family protein [Amycolatopsis orientalis]
MRASRLVSLLLLLQARQPRTAEELAARLEVSPRTVYRDIEALSAAGIPVYGEPGHDGGYRLVDGYRTQLTGLTRQEAEALFLTGLPAAASGLGLGPVAANTERKLLAALPAELRSHADRVRERFHLDAASWYHGPEATPQLPTVSDAVWQQRRVRIRYQRWAAPHEVNRTVEPHGVVLKAGQWYLVARSGEFRTYRVARIVEATMLDETFDRAEDFDLGGYWQSYLDDFDSRRHEGEAVLRLSPEGMRLLPQLAEPALARAAQSGVVESDGWTRVVVPVEQPDQAVHDLLRLGPLAEVVAPQQLRDRLAETLRSMLRRYPEVSG